MAYKFIDELDRGSVVIAADATPMVVGVTTSKVTAENLRNAINTEDTRWTLYTGTATGQLWQNVTVSDPSQFKIGTPIRYRYHDAEHYGNVSGIVGTTLTVDGHYFNSDWPIQSLYIGKPDMLRVWEFFIPGTYAGTIADILANYWGGNYTWNQGAAYLAGWAARTGTGSCTATITYGSTALAAVAITSAGWSGTFNFTSEQAGIASGDRIQIRTVGSPNFTGLAGKILFVTE